jgi:hypothetical protein
VIGTDVNSSIAGGGLAHDGAAVSAAVEQAVDIALRVPRKYDRLPPDERRYEVMRIGNLAFKTHIDPSSFENVLKFEFKYVVFSKCIGMHSEHMVIGSVVDECSNLARDHAVAGTGI